MKTTFKKSSLLALSIVIAVCLPFIASAQGKRPDIRLMSCAQAQALVEAKGGIVLTTGQYTYDRYVSDVSYCPLAQTTKDAWVATKDTDSCRIGYTCSNEPRFRWNSWYD